MPGQSSPLWPITPHHQGHCDPLEPVSSPPRTITPAAAYAFQLAPPQAYPCSLVIAYFFQDRLLACNWPFRWSTGQYHATVRRSAGDPVNLVLDMHGYSHRGAVFSGYSVAPNPRGFGPEWKPLSWCLGACFVTVISALAKSCNGMVEFGLKRAVEFIRISPGGHKWGKSCCNTRCAPRAIIGPSP